MRKNRSKDDAQLLAMGGILISIIVISSAVITINLSNSSIPLDKSDFIKTDFDNIRKEFGVALQDRLEEKMDYDEEDIKKFFYDIALTFSFAESLRDNYFFAEYIEITNTVDDRPNGIKAKLTVGNKNEFITEVVQYYIENV